MNPLYIHAINTESEIQGFLWNVHFLKNIFLLFEYYTI